MSLNLDEQNVKKQMQVAIATVLVAVIAYLYGRLAEKLFAEQAPMFSIIQLGLFGIFTGYVPVILRKLGYSDDVISQSMSAYGAAALLGQYNLMNRFSSLVTFI